MANNLEINVNVGLGTALNAMRQFDNVVAKASNTAAAFVQPVNNAGNAIAKLPSQISPATAALKSVEASTKSYSNALKTIPAATQPVNNALKASGNASLAFNQILREGPAFAFSFQTGLLGISNNLPVFTDAIKRAREAGAGYGTIFKDLAKNLVSLPSLLTIGVTALTIFGGALFDSSKDAKELDNSLRSAAEAVGQDIGNLLRLKAILNDTNIKQADRVKAVKEYNKTVEETNKIDVAQINNLGLINNLISAQINLKLQQAKAELINKQIIEKSNKLAEFGLKNSISDIEDARRKTEGSGDIILQQNQQYVKAGEKYVNVAGQVASSNKAIRTSAQQYLEMYQDLQFFIQRYTNDLTKLTTATTTAAKVQSSPFDVDISALENNLANAKSAIVELQTQIFNILSKGKTGPEIDMLKSVLNENQETEFLRIEETFLNQKLGIYQRYKKDTGALILELRTVQQQLAEALVIKSVKSPQEQPSLGTPTGKPQGNPQIAALFADFDLLQEKLEKTAAFVQGIVGPVFDQFFSNLGSGSKTALQAFGEAIKSVAVEIGKAIAKALLFAAIQTAITGGSFNIGSLLKNFKGFFGQFSGLKLASGGVTTGPTQALIGEGGVREAVIPLNRLPELVGKIAGGGGNTTIEHRISGNDLIVLINRSTGSNANRF